jgi:hypothetical protein
VSGVKTYLVVKPARRPGTLRTVQEVIELLASEDAPNELVAYEFTGALLKARLAAGAKVMSVDWREAEHDWWHYLGDLRDIVALRFWLAIFFTGPNCFQHMALDECLEDKIHDMRAYWAGVTVWWCVTCPHTLSSLVEQPNTIGHDFVRASEIGGVEVHHVRTGQYGDKPDKYIRLTTRNMTIAPPPYPDAPIVPKGEAPIGRFADADARDRVKSSWKPFTNMCASLAWARPTRYEPTAFRSYLEVCEEFALNWSRRGYPVPHDYDNADAQPSSDAERAYQWTRGRGRGWRAPTTMPKLVRAGQPATMPIGSAAPTGKATRGDGVQATPSEAPLEAAPSLTALEEARPLAEPESGVEPSSASQLELMAQRQRRFASGRDETEAERLSQAVQQAKRRFAAEQSANWKNKNSQGPQHTTRESPRETMATAPAADLPAGAAALVVMEPNPHGAVVYAPADRTQVHVVEPTTEAHGGLVAAAEAVVRRGVAGVKKLFGYRAGTNEEKQKLIVVAVERAADDSERVEAGGSHAPVNKARRQAATWCALAALAYTPLATFAKLAAVSATHYQMHDASTTTLLKSELTLRELMGMQPGSSPLLAPKWPALSAGGAITPRQLLQYSVDSLPLLRHELTTDAGPLAGYFAEWADSVQPLAVADIPSELLDRPLHLDDERLRGELFSEPLPVYETPWLARQPGQQWLARPGCEDFKPQSVLDLVDDEAKTTMKEWFIEEVKDLECLEKYGPECDRRDKPSEVVIGQDQFHYCAAGYFWDCRGEDCGLLQYDAPLDSDFNLEEGGFLREKLKDYPDQRLASNVLEGIRLEADLEMQIVLSPQLVSIGEGYDSVQKTVRELRSLNFYDFYRSLPFGPIFIVSQGSRIKKLGVKKYRRTSNFSAPHKSICDKSGVEVVPVNTASRCYFVPTWLSEHHDPAVVAWLEQKYEHVPPPRGGEAAASRHSPSVSEPGHLAGASARYKFPKEHKPHLGDLMHDATLLLQAARELAEPIFVWVEDAAFYFNQFAYAPEELWKSNLIVSARLEDLDSDEQEFDPGALVFVSERRLGFGSYASSNIAQRFSNAVVGWTMEEFDRLEQEALAQGQHESWRAWRARREGLELKCRTERPKRRGQAPSDCTQTRLAALKMYTDDPAGIVVGRARLKRMLAAWRHVTSEINLIMAGPDKRQLGAHIEWIGILIIAALGLVVVPRAKLVRAREALVRAVAGEMTFGEYRALMGLLEHLRFIAQLAADATNALYRPHGAQGESGEGPNAQVKPDELMTQKLKAWIDIVMDCAGALVTLAFSVGAVERLRAACSIFAGSADAAGDGEGEPGFGGYLHGFIWRVKLPLRILALMHITAWETLATAVNALVADRLAGEDAALSLRGDAALTPYAISQLRSRSRHVQYILHALIKHRRWPRIAPRLTDQHLNGDMNVPSDAISRALWAKLEVISQVLRTKINALRLEADEQRLVTDVVQHAARGAGQQEVSTAEIYEMFDQALPQGMRLLDGGATDRSGHDTSDDERRRRTAPKVARKRTLQPGEQKRGKRERGNTDGDGPQGRFRPPWLPTPAGEQVQITTRVSNADEKPHFRPPWLQAECGAVGTTSRPTSAAEKRGFKAPWRASHANAAQRQGGTGDERPHPYMRPAYDASRLRPDQAQHARDLARRLYNDKTAGRINAPYHEIEDMTMAVAEAKADGINPRTASKDAFALREFELFAKLRAFDPNLRTSWTRKFPEREKLKLAGFLLFRAQRARPRSPKDKVAKPMSIYQNYLALLRVFRGREVELPPAASVRETLRGLIQRAVRRFGIEWLRKKQVEPVTPPIIEKAVRLAAAGTHVLLSVTWTLGNWVCFIVTAWMVINMVAGSRKGESTLLPGDVDSNDYFTRASASYLIGGRTVVDPTEHELRSMKDGDASRLAPKGAKCDAYGTCYGTEPIVMPFHDTEINAAKWMRDIELRWPCHGEDRNTLPLFCDERGDPFTDKRFSSLIMAVLVAVLGAARAKLFSPHSWRVWLASALRMRKAGDPLIMAFGRWMNPESVKVYARLGTQEYMHWMDEIMKVRHIDATRTTNLPCMDAADALAGWQEQLDEPPEREIDATPTPPSNAVPNGTRVTVYWTEMDAWYDGVITSSRLEAGDDGAPQRATRVLYDATGPWRKQLAYWHCLDVETWDAL